MKAAQIKLKPLRDAASKRFDQFIAKYPEHKQLTEQLKRSTVSILEGASADFDTIQKLLPEIDRAADKSDDMYVYAAAQDVINELNDLARKSLSQNVPVFPEVAVSLKLSPSARASSASSKLGHRTKLGGEPHWVQMDETPACDDCQMAMTFIGQIDSIAMQSNALGKTLMAKKSFMFGDAGMIYVFLCTGCYKAKAVVQSG